MRIWNIGNTTVRNPTRLREALVLFKDKMSGRPFGKAEQVEFQGHMIDAGLVDSVRRDGDDGARKFASAFKQLGFVTDWGRGIAWTITPVGENLIKHPTIEATIFLRQLLQYQIPSPLERTTGFYVRPFRLLLRFLKQAHDEGLVGLTKHEIGLFVDTVLNEEEALFQTAFARIRTFRAGYDAERGKVAKNRYAAAQTSTLAAQMQLVPGTLLDYADSSSRYALLSGLLVIRGNKLAVSPARLAFITEVLAGDSLLLPDADYLRFFYDPELPQLPSDNLAFLSVETQQLLQQVQQISAAIGELYHLPTPNINMDLSELQHYEQLLRNELKRLREIEFYRNQCSPAALNEIQELLEDVQDGSLLGGQAYLPAFFEWAVWRVFLAINHFEGDVSLTRGFQIDEDMLPVHHAKGGAADLTFRYKEFVLVCEMTLATGSRQFTMEGEPVTRHVAKAIADHPGKPVYGVFVAKAIDPNTADAFHNARYWRNWNTVVATPVVALNMEQMLSMVRRLRQQPVTLAGLRQLLDDILAQQNTHDSGPQWYHAYSEAIFAPFVTETN